MSDEIDLEALDAYLSSDDSPDNCMMLSDLDGFLPGDLKRQISGFVDYYNNRRYHESLQNITPADVYFGRGQTILRQRERIKQKTIETRRLLHRKSAA